MSMLAIASSAEDEILRAQALGAATALTTKQKLALRKKLGRELKFFMLFLVCFIWSVYSRRLVKEAFLLQEAVRTAFVEEEFGDYNEKTYYDIANAEELFDWMAGPLSDGLFPDQLYNDQEIPQDRKGYVMTYNKIIGQIRLRQLRVRPSAACELSPAVTQAGTTSTGRQRSRQFVDHCYAKYNLASRDNSSFGANVSLQVPLTGGFAWSNATTNKLGLSNIQGQTGQFYDGSGFVRDIDADSRFNYLQALEQLKSNLWIDERTRAVLVSMNLYNGNYNYYCVSQFLIEFTPGGTVVPTATNKIVRLDLYEPAEFQQVVRRPPHGGGGSSKPRARLASLRSSPSHHHIQHKPHPAYLRSPSLSPPHPAQSSPRMSPLAFIMLPRSARAEPRSNHVRAGRADDPRLAALPSSLPLPCLPHAQGHQDFQAAAARCVDHHRPADARDDGPHVPAAPQFLDVRRTEEFQPVHHSGARERDTRRPTTPAVPPLSLTSSHRRGSSRRPCWKGAAAKLRRCRQHHRSLQPTPLAAPC